MIGRICAPAAQARSLLHFEPVAVEKPGAKGVAAGQNASGQQDFAAEGTRVKELDPQPDVIRTSAYEPTFPAFIKQLRTAGTDTPVSGIRTAAPKANCRSATESFHNA